MAVIRCKMCGGTLNVTEGQTVCECEYCGSVQTIPQADDEKKLNLYNRANRLRMNSEFDKAAGIFEQIIAEYPEEAEAYWGLCLCNYGIEYVDDPATGRKIPTCHRASFGKLRKDEIYERALENADPSARLIYQEEAREIDRIMGEILALSRNESPYDIFICYKETDNYGSRTPDSVIAQDIYDALTEKGYKVFFSRITLEDKLGQQYEPYIFAALNSAKVMLAVGTDYEYYSAVWVKNEWSRYLKLMASDKTKMLIPCYRDMDPYDLPDEFKGLQAQDLGKLGFLQDLQRGIDKIFGRNDRQPASSAEGAGGSTGNNTAALLKRVSLFLEDGNWKDAEQYCERVLDQDPENAQAYLGKLMAEFHVRHQEELGNCERPFTDSDNYKKVIRFGDDKIAEKLSEAIRKINERAEEQREAAKQKAEEVKRSASAVAAALKKGEADAEAGPALDKDLRIAKKEVKDLEQVLSIFGSTMSQIQALQNELSEETSREKTLADRRSRLGIFSGKEKKRIDEELAAVSVKKDDLSARIDQQKKTIGFYNTIEEAERDLNEARNKVSGLETQLESARTDANIYQEALKAYLSEPGVTRAVNAALYPTVSSNSIVFGRYTQKENNQSEPIEWQILSREAGRMFVVSKYLLVGKPFHDINKPSIWENCWLRKWMNSEFINTAFNPVEQGIIVKTTNKDKASGTATYDKVFLLSVEEVEKYFSTDSSRLCKATAYAKATWVYTNSSGNGEWWLRTPGSYSYDKVKINSDGTICKNYIGGLNKLGIRPAMWVSY